LDEKEFKKIKDDIFNSGKESDNEKESVYAKERDDGNDIDNNEFEIDIYSNDVITNLKDELE